VIGKEAEEISLEEEEYQPLPLCNPKIVPVATPHKNRKIIRLSSIEKFFGPQCIVL
jgi:hypothetical protein